MPHDPHGVSDPFDLPALDAALKGSRFAGKLHFFSDIPSTNTHAMQQAEAGAPDGSVYFADEQTAGRGRAAHAWASPPGSGLYVSILLRPRIAPADILWLSLAAGLAVRAAIREVTTLEADLRWPNDLLFGARNSAASSLNSTPRSRASATWWWALGSTCINPSFLKS